MLAPTASQSGLVGAQWLKWREHQLSLSRAALVVYISSLLAHMEALIATYLNLVGAWQFPLAATRASA